MGDSRWPISDEWDAFRELHALPKVAGAFNGQWHPLASLRLSPIGRMFEVWRTQRKAGRR